MRAIIGAPRHEVEAQDPYIGYYVVAGATDLSLWENDPDGWDAFAAERKEAFDPSGEYDWREVTVSIQPGLIDPLFLAPTIEGRVHE